MKSNKKLAKETNVAVFGNKTRDLEHAAEWDHYNQPLPKSKTELNRLIPHLCRKHKENTDPTNVSNVHLNVLNQVYEIAMRKNLQYLDSVICPHCEEEHTIHCPECDTDHNIDILDSTAEKTSVTCLNIMANKFFPNRAPENKEVDIEAGMHIIGEHFTEMISIAPEDLKKLMLNIYQRMIDRLEDET